MDRIPEEVIIHIQEYVQEKLPNYEVVKVRR